MHRSTHNQIQHNNGDGDGDGDSAAIAQSVYENISTALTI